MKLIPKDALVAEIERQKAQWRICKSSEAKYRREMLDDISSFLDTIEVKEVDLDAELEHYKAEQNIKYEEDINMFEFAKHFYQLGLAQKGE